MFGRPTLATLSRRSKLNNPSISSLSDLLTLTRRKVPRAQSKLKKCLYPLILKLALLRRIRRIPVSLTSPLRGLWYRGEEESRANKTFQSFLDLPMPLETQLLGPPGLLLMPDTVQMTCRWARLAK